MYSSQSHDPLAKPAVLLGYPIKLFFIPPHLVVIPLHPVIYPLQVLILRPDRRVDVQRLVLQAANHTFHLIEGAVELVFWSPLNPTVKFLLLLLSSSLCSQLPGVGVGALLPGAMLLLLLVTLTT